MLDLNSFSRYRIHPDGTISNKRGRILPNSKTLRLVDDNGERHLVTRKRLLYQFFYGDLQPGERVTGEFPNLRVKESKQEVDDVTTQAIIRKIKQGHPISVIARDLHIGIKTVERCKNGKAD
jgi:hypothetical protein